MAMEMGRTTVFSAIEAAGAMVELGKAGFTTKEILEGIGPAVASLAAAGDLPLTRATEILANTLRTFNLEAKDAVYVADQLAGAANASTIEVEDLAVSLRYTGGVASSLGIPLHEVADALAILGNNGIRGSTAGTTLRRILLELNPATKKQTEALIELGIIQENANFSAEQLAEAQKKVFDANNRVASAQERVNALTKEYAAAGAPKTAQEAAQRTQALSAAQEELADAQDLANRAAEGHRNTTQGLSNQFFDAQGKAKSLGEIFQIVEDRTKHLNAAEKQRVLDIIFGSRAIAGALILAREGADGFAKISEQIEKVSAAEVAAKRLDNLAGSLKRLKNILITEMVAASGPLLGMLKGIVDGVTSLIERFGGLPGPIKQALLVATALFGALAVGAGALLILGSFVARAVRAFIELRGAFTGANVAKTALDKNVPILSGLMAKLSTVVGFLLKPLQLLRTAFMFVVTGIAAFLGVSVGVVVAVLAIIAILVILIAKVKPVREFFLNLGSAILDFFQAIPGVVAGAASAIGGFFSRLGEIAGSVLSAIGGFFARLPGLIAGAASTVGSAIASFIAGVVSFGAGLVNFFASLPGTVITFLGQVLSAVGNFLVQLPERLAYATGFLIGMWIRLWLTFLERTSEGVALIVAAVALFFVDMVTRFIEGGVQIIAAFVGLFVGLFNLAVEWTPKIISAIIDWFQQLPGRLATILDQAWEAFSSWADRTWDRAYQLGSDVLAAIVEWFQQLPGNIISFLDQTWTGFASWADRMWDRAYQMGSDVLSAVVEWFQQLPGRVAEFMSNAVQNMWNAAGQAWDAAGNFGANAFNAISDGISGIPGLVGGVLQRAIDAFLGVIGQAYNAARRLASALWNGFKDGLFGSPHTKIEYAVWDMVANVETSIRDLRDQVKRILALGAEIAASGSIDLNSPALQSLRQQVQVLGTQAAAIGPQATTNFYNEFHTDADPVKISDEIMWQQRVR